MPHTFSAHIDYAAFAFVIKLNNLSLAKLCFIPPPLGIQSEAGVREFHIVQVSSSSQHWRLHKCINPAKDKGVSGKLSLCASFLQCYIPICFLVFIVSRMNGEHSSVFHFNRML